MIKKYVISTIVLLSIFVYAGESQAITVGPERIEVSLPPGEIGVADYYVQNETDRPIHVVVEPENWHRNIYNYENLPVEDWIELDIYEFDLKPKEIKKLALTVKVPAEITGEIVAQIFFSSTPGGEKKAATGITTRVGVILYVAIKGTEKVEAEIEGVNILKTAEEDKERLRVDVKVKNSGNVHIRPTGNIVITDEKGKKIDEAGLISGRAVKPGRKETYYAYPLEIKPDKGKYNVTATLDYGKLFDMEKKFVSKRTFEINEDGEVGLK